MKTLEKKIQKMTAAIEAMNKARERRDVAGNFKHEYKTLELHDGQTVQVATDETIAKIDAYFETIKESDKAVKTARKAVEAVLTEMGLQLKTKLVYETDIKRLAQRLVWRYEEAMTIIHRVYACDEFMRIPETGTL